MASNGGKQDTGPTAADAALPEELMLEALTLVLRAGNPEELGLTRRKPVEQLAAAMVVSAPARRLLLTRSAILNAALAAEAAANFYIAVELPEYVDVLDRLDAPKKLLCASRLARTDPELRLDQTPLSGITRLWRLRNRLVHPGMNGRRRVTGKDAFDFFGSNAAIEAILSVGSILVRLSETQNATPRLDAEIARFVVTAWGPTLRARGREIQAGLPEPLGPLAELLRSRSP